MTLAQQYEINLLNELIAAMFENAAMYRKAVLLVDNEYRAMLLNRAANRSAAAEFLQRYVTYLRGKPAASDSIVTAAFAALAGTLHSADKDIVSPKALARADDTLTQRFDVAFADAGLSQSVIEAVRQVCDRVELPATGARSSIGPSFVYESIGHA